MRRIALLAAAFLAVVGMGAAPCPVIYTPPNSFLHLTDETQGLLVYNEQTNTERYVVRQAYSGVANDFALVFPTPSEPEMTERSEELFKQLNKMTKEPEDDDPRLGGGMMAQTISAEKQVEVVKTRNVGDFNATVLKADDAQALVDWLNANGYDFKNRSVENFRYYVQKNETFYFTALKINVDEAACLTREEYEQRQDAPDRLRRRMPDTGDGWQPGMRCYLQGGLSPVEFQFESDAPMLPFRILSREHDDSPITGGEGHSHEPGNFLLYTLSDQPLVVPGAKVEYANTVTDPGNALQKYMTGKDFLVRQRFKFDARKIDHDLTLTRTAPFHVGRAETKVINPQQTDTANGIISFTGNAAHATQTTKPGAVAGTAFWLDRFGYGVGRAMDAVIDIANLLVGIVLFIFIAPGQIL